MLMKSRKQSNIIATHCFEVLMHLGFICRHNIHDKLIYQILVDTFAIYLDITRVLTWLFSTLPTEVACKVVRLHNVIKCKA